MRVEACCSTSSTRFSVRETSSSAALHALTPSTNSYVMEVWAEGGRCWKRNVERGVRVGRCEKRAVWAEGGVDWDGMGGGGWPCCFCATQASAAGGKQMRMTPFHTG
eukprot:297225-Chlamydomonas_euryale.AAC.1